MKRELVGLLLVLLLVAENGRLHPQYAADYLHINEAGYQVLNEALVGMLEPVDTP